MARLWEDGAWDEGITGVSVLDPAEVLGPVCWGWLDWRCTCRIVPLLDIGRFSEHGGYGLTVVDTLQASHHYFENLLLIVCVTVDRSWTVYGGRV